MSAPGPVSAPAPTDPVEPPRPAATPAPAEPPDAASPGRMAKRLGVAALGLGTAVLALVGALTVTRGTPVERLRAPGGGAMPAVADPGFARTVALYSGAALTEGNAVEVLTDGDGTYPRLWADLRAARRLVAVQLYYSQPGAVADTMARVLAERARAGVRVLVVLDAFGSQNLPPRWFDTLRTAGAEVVKLRRMRWYKLDRATRRSHVRAITVDGAVGYAGGFGLADYWQGDGRTPGEWRETNVRFRGPAVAQLQAAFGAAWAEATGELLVGDGVYPPPNDGVADGAAGGAAGGVRAALVHTAPPAGSTPAERLLALSIAGARRTLYVTNAYFLPDDDFRRLLCGAAGRGVDVRVLTAGARTDIETVYYASRARYAELLGCGVRLYEYRPAMIHAKTLVADGLWATVGSMNFDNRSLALNDEATLVALDPGVGRALDSLFRADLRYADEVTAAAFARRPWWERPLERGATLLSRVL